MRLMKSSLTLLLVAAFCSFTEQPSLAVTVSQTANAGPEEEAPDNTAPEDTAETGALEWDIDVHVVFNDRDVNKIDPTLRHNKLHLAGSRITNASLADVRLLAQVNLLSIEGTQITNAGLERLKGMTQLGALRLWNQRFTDAALVHIKGLPRLESLDLEGTSVQGTTLAQLSELPALRTLTLGPLLNDTALEALRSLRALEELDLRSCHQISDAGLTQLEGLKNLRILWLPAQITEARELQFRQALPSCEVRR